MKCTNFLGHTWSSWRNNLGSPSKGSTGKITRTVLLARRCAHCGYIEEVWTNSCIVLEEAPTSEEGEK